MSRRGVNAEQFELVRHFAPDGASKRGRNGANNLLFMETVLFKFDTGIAWRDLPARYGKWKAVWLRFGRWSAAGRK